MIAPLASYSDDERERLRTALRDYAAHFALSPQQLANRIAEATNYALDFDAGRKRVERFLKGTHRQPDDFIGAIAAFLGSVPPPDIEQMAASLAHFFGRHSAPDFDSAWLAGRYLAWVSTARRPEYHEGLRHMTVMMGHEFTEAPADPMESRFAYAVIEMRPHLKTDTLMVSEAFVNPGLDPEIIDFPAQLPGLQDSGILVPFGFSDRAIPRYLMTTRSVLETRLYRLYRVAERPLTLRGDVYFTGKLTRDLNMTHSDPLYPDYEIELVREGDEDEGDPGILDASKIIA